MSWFQFRTIVLQPSASKACDSFNKEFDRFEEAFDGLQWLLTRNPDKGRRRSTGDIQWHVYVQAPDILAKTPEIWVLYRYDEDEVVIEALNAKAFDPEG